MRDPVDSLREVMSGLRLLSGGLGKSNRVRLRAMRKRGETGSGLRFSRQHDSDTFRGGAEVITAITMFSP